MNKEQIEKMEWGPEMDGLIAQHIFGWPSMRKWKPGECYDDAKRLAKKSGVDTICWWTGNNWHPWKPFEENSLPIKYHFSADIDAAWTVVEAAKARGWLLHILEMTDGWMVNGNRYELDNGKWTGAEMLASDFIQIEADTAPLAICRCSLLAALSAKGVQ